jgi:WD40 repeat protein
MQTQNTYIPIASCGPNLIKERRKYISLCLLLFLPKDISNLISEYDYKLEGIMHNVVEHSDISDDTTILPDGRLFFGRIGYSCRMWNPNTKTYVNFKDQNVAVKHIDVLSDGRIVTASFDNLVKIWNADGTCDITFSGHINYIWCISVLPDGRIVSGSADHTAKIWNPTTGLCDLTFTEHLGIVSCVCIISHKMCDSTNVPNYRIVTGSIDRTIKIWNPNDGKCDITFARHSAPIRCIATLFDGPSGCFGERVVSGSEDNTLKIWNPRTGNCDVTLLGHAFSVTCVSVLPDGRIISGSADETVKIWNTISKNSTSDIKLSKVIDNCDATYDHGDIVQYIFILSDGRVATKSYNNPLRIWN